MLQDLEASPVHWAPPLQGAGFEHVRAWVPPPHVVEHAAKADQPPSMLLPPLVPQRHLKLEGVPQAALAQPPALLQLLELRLLLLPALPPPPTVSPQCPPARRRRRRRRREVTNVSNAEGRQNIHSSK